jgi:hypothetical protein
MPAPDLLAPELRSPYLRAPDAAASLERTPAATPKLNPIAEAARPIDGGARIGHVHLKVADLDRGSASTPACSASR